MLAWHASALVAGQSLTGATSVLRKLLGQARAGEWSHQVSFGLRCDLAKLPDVPRARVKIDMQRVDASFEGFTREAEAVSGDDRGEALLRARMLSSGIERLYVAMHEGSPVYAQWLITAEHQDGLHRFSPGLYPRLAPGEALLEGAYTFVSFRGFGAMADGMMQLLEIARDEGLRSVQTFVSAGYPPSIRGCARVGFGLDSLRLDGRRLGARTTAFAPVDARAIEVWRATTSG